MPDIVLTHDDQEITFSLDDVSQALPDGHEIVSGLDDKYVAKGVVKSEFVPKSEFKRRLKSAKENAHEDESVIARVLDSHQVDVPDKDALFKQWETAYLDPKQAELDEFQSVAKGARIRAAASKYFNDAFVLPVSDGTPSYAEIALDKQFKSEGHDVYPVDSGGDPLLPLDLQSGRTRRTVDEHMSILAEDPALKQWLKAPPKGGGGSGRPGDKLNMGGGKSIENMSESELAAGIRDKSITYDRNGDLHIVT